MKSNTPFINRNAKVELDSSDLALLKILRADSRTSLTEIGEKIGLSRFSVRDRIEKLFHARIIQGPTVVLNPFSVGLGRNVFFEFKTNPHEPWLAKLLEATASCDLLDGISGEYSLFARLRLADDEHFNTLLRKIDEAMGKSVFKKYRVVNAIRIFKEDGVAFNSRQVSVSKLDQVDNKILEILLNQTKYVKTPLPLSTVELSQQLRNSGVNISQPAVFTRLSRLERKGVILRHAERLDYLKLGLRMKFIVRMKVNPSVYDVVAQKFIASMDEISDLYRTGEEYGLLAVLRMRDVSEYNAFLLRLYGSKDILDTYTTLVLEERKSTPFSLRKD